MRHVKSIHLDHESIFDGLAREVKLVQRVRHCAGLLGHALGVVLAVSGGVVLTSREGVVAAKVLGLGAHALGRPVVAAEGVGVAGLELRQCTARVPAGVRGSLPGRAGGRLRLQ